MQLQRGIPEYEGIPSKAINSFLTIIEKENIELHSFMLLRNGKVVSEGSWSPYDLNEKHEMFSVTKSITATAIGFALQENKLSLDDKVISFFPEFKNLDMDSKMKLMTVRHLLNMTTGYFENMAGNTELSQVDGSWIKEFLGLPLTYFPGTKFVYNSAASHILSAIISKATKQSISEYLKPRLFEPLKIKDYFWEADPEGNNTGGWGIRLKTEDVAKFGQFCLQKGKWDEEQILSKEFMEQATSIQVSNADSSEDIDSQQGYGYQFWMSKNGAYRATGMFCQICLVLPQQNAVFVVTGGTERKQDVLNIFWETIYPNFLSEDVTIDKKEQEKLKKNINNLLLIPEQPHSVSTIGKKVSNRPYNMKDNVDNIRSVKFDFTENSCRFTLLDKYGEHKISCGLGHWIEQETTMSGAPLHLLQQPSRMRVKAKGFWNNEKVFIMTWTFYEMAFTDTVVCYFEDDQIILKRSVNDQGPYLAERPTMIGKASR